jgi:hypothetical protein
MMFIIMNRYRLKLDVTSAEIFRFAFVGNISLAYDLIIILKEKRSEW